MIYLKKILYQAVDKIFNWVFRIHNFQLQESYKKQILIGENSTIHVPPLCPQIDNQTYDPSKIRIGKGTHIRGTIFVYPYAMVGCSFGNNSYFGENSIIRVSNSITIGNNVLIAHNVTIIDTDSHEITPHERASSYADLLRNGHPKKSPDGVLNAPILIKDYAWISYGVSILKGVTIGEGAIIGCGSVVTHDIPDYCLAVGNPARIVKVLNK